MMDKFCAVLRYAGLLQREWLLLLVAASVAARLVDEVVWVKMTVNRRLFKSHGYYLQHAKEVCMVARKNSSPQEQQQQQQQQGSSSGSGVQQGQLGVSSDIIFSERRGQSQKPEEIYELIEALVPNGEHCRRVEQDHSARCALHTDGPDCGSNMV